MQKNRGNNIKVILSFVFLVSLFYSIDYSLEIYGSKGISPGWDALKLELRSFLFLVVIPITLLNLFFRYLRWVFLLRNFNIIHPSRELFVAHMTSFIGNIFPLYIPYLIRLIPLRKKFFNAFLILALDLFIDLFSVLFLVYTNEIGIYIVISLFVILLPILSSFPSKGKDKATPIWKKTFGILFSFVLSVSIWTATALSLWIVLFSFGENISVFDSINIYSISISEGVFSFLPGGVTTAGTELLEQLQALGVNDRVAYFSTSILRLLTFWFTIFVSMIAFVYYFKSFRNNKEGDHFDDISEDYKDIIPEHIRLKLLKKKVTINKEYLPASDFRKGLDAGCGQGWYIKEMNNQGYHTEGIDYSQGQVDLANEYLGKDKALVKQASITDLPYEDNSLDFVYSINIIHHLFSYEDQIQALEEVQRVLRPGGRFIIHEMNIKNPIFRFYMSYIFPLIKSIDEGTEIWVQGIETHISGFKIVDNVYKTFMPDFIPRAIMNILEGFESKLEDSKYFRKFSAHITIILEKE